MSLCKYKNIFGEPGKGVHSIRIFNIAVVDLLATLLVAYAISRIYKKITFLEASVFMLLLGIIFHHLFCVRTTIDKLLFRE